MRWVILLIVLVGCTRIEAHFCDNVHCNGVFSEHIERAEHADCAFYSLGSAQVIQALKDVNARVVLHKPVEGLGARLAKPVGLMHNKFCVLDYREVITGSYNPYDGLRQEWNNLVVVYNKRIAGLYEDEFQELWSGLYGAGSRAAPQIGFHYQAFFCPEDDCASKLIEEINRAKRQISFMYFSFSSGEVALALIRARERGVEVRGIIESSQISQYSQYQFLRHQGVNVSADNSSSLLHHKFIVIDNRTIITGSFNPTKNGQLRNDENLIILRNKKVASWYAQLLSGV